MTANAFAEDVKNALDAGMNDHIAKPIDIEIIRRVLGKYLPSSGLDPTAHNTSAPQDT